MTEQTLVLKATPTAVIELVKKVCAAFNWTVASADAGHMLLKTGMSLRSWGENIDVSVSQGTTGHVNVLLKSGPKMGLVDWGKSGENIKTLSDALQQKFH
jgi:hypothetical protein